MYAATRDPLTPCRKLLGTMYSSKQNGAVRLHRAPVAGAAYTKAPAGDTAASLTSAAKHAPAAVVPCNHSSSMGMMIGFKPADLGLHLDQLTASEDGGAAALLHLPSRQAS